MLTKTHLLKLDITKVVRENFMAISGYILKRQKIKNKSYMLPFRKVDKEQVKSKVSKKKKKMCKTRPETKEINTSKIWSFANVSRPLSSKARKRKDINY